MKIKTATLIGAQLDWAVAKCEGKDCTRRDGSGWTADCFNPSTDWAQGGSIIEREKISTVFCDGDLGEPQTYWVATTEPQSWAYGYGPYHTQDEDRSLQIYKSDVTKGPTELIAKMRCYVASKLGDEVEIPEELL